MNDNILNTCFLVIGSILMGIGTGNWWIAGSVFFLGSMFVDKRG